MAEQRTFVFAVTFIILFSALVVSIPTDLLGADESPSELSAIDPSFVTDFSDSETFQKSDFEANLYWYPAILGGYYFFCAFITITASFYIGAKVLWFGLWLGALSACDWTNIDGIKNDGALSFADIDSNAENGLSKYTLNFEEGTYAGTFLFYWNITAYSDSEDAWDNDELYLLHGVGVESNPDVVALLISLLFLQLPDCPVLINALLATPIWACVIYLIWFIIKESLPFV